MNRRIRAIRKRSAASQSQILDANQIVNTMTSALSYACRIVGDKQKAIEDAKKDQKRKLNYEKLKRETQKNFDDTIEHFKKTYKLSSTETTEVGNYFVAMIDLSKKLEAELGNDSTFQIWRSTVTNQLSGQALTMWKSVPEVEVDTTEKFLTWFIREFDIKSCYPEWSKKIKSWKCKPNLWRLKLKGLQ